MTTYRHTAPILPGEDILEMPKSDDPRVKPWVEHLMNEGVMDLNGNATRRVTLRRGICPAGYVWELDVHDEQISLAQDEGPSQE